MHSEEHKTHYRHKARKFLPFFKKNLLTRFKYWKLSLFVVLVFAAYYLFSIPSVDGFVKSLGDFSYIGAFIGGLMFSFGFTTPFAIGFFVNLAPSNIYATALIGGAGALISDLLIFRIIRFSFQDEFDALKKEHLFKEFSELINHTIGKKIKSYLALAFAGFLIASPLPDEAGITILAGVTRIKEWQIGVISFVFNSIGILVFLLV